MKTLCVDLGGSLPNIIDGGADFEIGTFNTKTK